MSQILSQVEGALGIGKPAEPQMTKEQFTEKLKGDLMDTLSTVVKAVTGDSPTDYSLSHFVDDSLPGAVELAAAQAAGKTVSDLDWKFLYDAAYGNAARVSLTAIRKAQDAVSSSLLAVVKLSIKYASGFAGPAAGLVDQLGEAAADSALGKKDQPLETPPV
jgi:hypothetical protein